jgi:hypothetical protein
MKITNFIRIKAQSGLMLQVPVEKCGDREAGTIFIDGIPYHIERMSNKLLRKKYKVDADSDYVPQTDDANRCVVVAPFSKK